MWGEREVERGGERQGEGSRDGRILPNNRNNIMS